MQVPGFPQARPAQVRNTVYRQLPAASPADLTPPALGPAQRRACARDLIYLLGRNIKELGARVASLTCQQLQLRSQVVKPDMTPRGLGPAILELHCSGALAAQSHVVIDMHGIAIDGKHYLDFDQRIETIQLIRLLREGGLQFGLPYWDGCVEIHTCHGGALWELLAGVEGMHLICSGEGEVVTYIGWKTVAWMLPLLKQSRDSVLPGSLPEALFARAQERTPSALAMVGLGLDPALRRQACMPEDLAGAEPVRIKDAFLHQLMAGTHDTVLRFLAVWPGLMDVELNEVLPIIVAVDKGDVGLVKLLLREKADWNAQLYNLLDVSARVPACRDEALAISVCVFAERAAVRLIAAAPAPQHLREATLQLALDHLQRSLACLDSQTGCRLLLKELTSQTRNPLFDVFWQLLEGLSLVAAAGLPLAERGQTDAFMEELRRRLVSVVRARLR